MKKIILATLLTLSTLSADWIGQAGLGYSRGDNGANYVTAFYGAEVYMGAGLRVEYTKNFSEHAEFSKEDLSRYGLFLTYQFSLIPYLSITPKMGIVNSDGEVVSKTDLVKAAISSTKFTYGLELDYYYSNFVSFYLGYTDYGNELDVKNLRADDIDKLDTANYTLGFKLHL